MRSIYGQIGQICETFGWTYDYVFHKVDWRIVRRMMLDLPRPVYDNDSKDQKTSPVKKTNKSGFYRERMTADSWVKLKK